MRHGRGPCGSRPRTRGFHAGGRGGTRRTTPEPRVGRRDDAIRVRPSMATMATMATPWSRLSKKILAARWGGGVNQRTLPVDFFYNFSFRGGQGGHPWWPRANQPSSGSSLYRPASDKDTTSTSAAVFMPRPYHDQDFRSLGGDGGTRPHPLRPEGAPKCAVSDWRDLKVY